MINHAKYNICSNCVMDTSDAKITFDENGICDQCLNYYNNIRPHWQKMKADKSSFYKTIDKIRQNGIGKPFDCIIGMSGGLDSSYLVYIAKEHLGLRPLVFHVDAGWNSQIAVNNIEKIVDGLGLDLFTEVINWNEMQDLQRSFFRSGVSHIDAPQDHAFFATMYKFASKHNIKHILTGANLSTECIRNPIEWMYYQSDSRQLKHIHKLFGEIKLKTFPTTNIIWHKIFLPYFRGIKIHRPLDYFDYIAQDAKSLLMSKFGWQPYPRKHFESRFTKFYESFWLPQRFGYDVRRVQYSSLILTNQMQRSDALNLLESLPYDKEKISQEIEFIANKLDMSTDELMHLITIPKKNFTDYKNQQLTYKFGASVLRGLKLEVGGKR